MTGHTGAPNGGRNTSGQGWQYKDQHTGSHKSSGQSGSQPPRKPEFNIGEWVPIFILFFFGATAPIAVIWALVKLANIVKANKNYQDSLRRFGRTAADATRDVADAMRREVNNLRGNASSASSSERKNQPHSGSSPNHRAHSSTGQTSSFGKKPKKPKGGTALVVLGIIFTACFGLLALICMIVSAPIGVAFVLALLMLGSLVMLGGGIRLNRRKERFLNYLAYIGSNREVGLVNMALSFGVSIKTLCKDLRKMLADGNLPTGYLDLAAGKLFLTETGYRPSEYESEPKSGADEAPEKTDEDQILREIRQINDSIPDEVMSAKIHRIEEITGKILSYQKSHPDKSGQLRSFLNYYLPTTLKILRAYAQLDAQGIEGENISAAKARIEGMMDQVVSGFEKQLDKLFQDDVLDISSDVQVLENMLKKDGLSDHDQQITMTL